MIGLQLLCLQVDVRKLFICMVEWIKLGKTLPTAVLHACELLELYPPGKLWSPTTMDAWMLESNAEEFSQLDEI